MKNVLVTRIDDRLIHGQVVTAWIKDYPINKILIADDELSQNKLMGRIYRAAAPMGVEVVLMNVNDSIQLLHENQLKGENYMVLAKTPEVIEKIIESGFVTNKIILGGMGATEKRKRFNRNVSASESEIETFRRIISKNIKIVYQLVPSDREVDIKDLL
ncbi:PTS system mannose/fructose/N-acetylgalactosamine-transporter subunit IIB [Anaerorhabdus sp.]|jgi:mannose/fructose/N-acetylgalactosamine-specific phosphotransferase system component IIB|uniref:PTS system mannose/fructose/N-acetylgalactosamine-transporter subunit IIB n=1 Tax=Anaerorhabdus sp. TaxID=1872524 RepID=UPI002FCA9C0A